MKMFLFTKAVLCVNSVRSQKSQESEIAELVSIWYQPSSPIATCSTEDITYYADSFFHLLYLRLVRL